MQVFAYLLRRYVACGRWRKPVMKIGSRGRCRCMVRTQEAVGFLMFAKAKLGDNAYKELV